MRRLLFASLIVALLSACALLTEPVTGAFPPNTKAIAPLDSYPVWWAEVEACSGIADSLVHVHFWTVPDRYDFRLPSDTSIIVYGYFAVPMNIVLAEYRMEWKAGVQHEMLHALLYRRFGDSYYRSKDTHPTEYFVKRCPFVAQNGS
jgi:hypothetical protein